MPVIESIQFDPKSLNLSVERDAKRSPGIHLSSIIKDRLITAGVERRVKGAVPFTPEEQHLIFERGFLWERMVAEYVETDEWVHRQIDALASKHFAAGVLETNKTLVRPGESVRDGIYMTADALNMHEYAVEEWKATGLRFRKFGIEARRQEWLWQACSYAGVFGMTKAIFRIWHVNDNIINSLRVVWTEEEIAENWRQMLEHREFMKQRRTP